MLINSKKGFHVRKYNSCVNLIFVCKHASSLVLQKMKEDRYHWICQVNNDRFRQTNWQALNQQQNVLVDVHGCNSTF